MTFDNFYYKKSGIYAIVNKVNSKIYIGSTSDFYIRFHCHLSKLKLNKHENNFLQKSVNKYGIENFEFKIMEVVEINSLIEIEQNYLDKYFDNCKNCYNICPIANSTIGYKVTDETKKKLSLAFSGEKNPFFGKKHTEEALKKIKDARAKQVFSDESIKKLNESRFRRKIICLNDNKIFNSAIEAEKFYNLKHNTISGVVRSKRKAILGFKFMYLEEFENANK